jgi:hypothetical protein
MLSVLTHISGDGFHVGRGGAIPHPSPQSAGVPEPDQSGVSASIKGVSEEADGGGQYKLPIDASGQKAGLWRSAESRSSSLLLESPITLIAINWQLLSSRVVARPGSAA